MIVPAVQRACHHRSYLYPHLSALYQSQRVLILPLYRRFSDITMASKEKAHDHVKDFLSFVDQSPTPYHAVHNVIHRLEAAGFERVRERENWSSVCEPGGKYYVTRNTSSIVAFAIGERWQPGNPVAAIGAHTDSPCLRVKPVSKRQSEGYLQVGVET